MKFESLYKVYVAVDPQLGAIAIGYHEERPSIVAWDIRNNVPLWNALTEVEEIADLEVENIAVHGHDVYLALEEKLWCLDLRTGHVKWSRRLAQKPDAGEGCLAVADPYPPGVHGAILVPAGEGQWLYALDRESGAVLWEREYEDNVKVEAAEGLGTCVVRSDYARVEIINPAQQQPIWTLEKHPDTAKPIHGNVLTILDDGIHAFDARNGNHVFFDPVTGLDSERVPVSIDRHVFAVRDGDRGIYAGPQGRHLSSPVARTQVGHILAANHTLGVLCYVVEGDDEGVRHFVGLDPVTLALKYDAGAIGVGDDTDYALHVATDNASFVLHVMPTDDTEDAELRSIESATGRVIWAHKTPYWREHYFRGGLLIVHLKGRLEVRAPATGQVIAFVAEDD